MRRTLLFILLGGIGLAVGLYFQGRDELVILRPLSHKAALGTREDPQARARYEWMRLRDPVTGSIPANIRQKELEFAATLPTKESLARSRMRNSSARGGLAKEQLLTWSARGPYNIGGRTRALAIDVTNENIILGGGVSGGMWRSTNAGGTWTRVSPLAGIQSVTCIAQDTRSGNTAKWYYGTGELRGNSASGGAASYRGDGVFKSTDGGLTWSQLPITVSGTPQSFDQPFDYIWNIVTDPSNSTLDEVYAATFGGIQRSTDGGSSWTTVRGGFSNFESVHTDVAITSSGVVYATLGQSDLLGGTSASRGIWRSTDGGTWTNITPVGWPATYNRVVIGIAPSNQNVVYFLAETPLSGTNSHSLWKYDNVAWTNRSANIPMFGGNQGVGDFDSQGSYDIIVKVKPDNENVVFIGGTNLYRSTDGFATTLNTTWIGGYENSGSGFGRYPDHHPDQHSMVFLPSNASVLVSGHDGGISKTTNILSSPVAWTSLNTGYYTTQFYTVAIDHATSGNNIVIGGMQDNGTWFTNTTSSTTAWVEVMGGDGAACAIASGRTSYYGSFQNGVVYRLILDAGGNLQDYTRVDPTGGTGYLFINPFVLDPNNTNRMYLAGGDRVWRNSDLTGIPLTQSGSTTSINWANLTNSQIVGSTITALGMSTTPANRLYYGTHNGKVQRLDSANTGNPSPVDIWTGKGFPSNAYVSCIAVDPVNGDNAMVVFSNYSVVSLFYTTDSGTNWTPVAGNLEQFVNGTGNGPSCRWVAVHPVTGGTYYFVGTSTGVYSTTTLGGGSTAWSLEGSSTIGNAVVDMIVNRPSDGLVVAATHSNGMYSTNVTTVGVQLTDANMPDEFTLMQNYPNPFNPSTSIQYALPREAEVSLKVYTVEGEEVVTLVDWQQAPGTYTASWDGRNRFGMSVSSGVYFYQLRAGEFSETKRMVMMK